MVTTLSLKAQIKIKVKTIRIRFFFTFSQTVSQKHSFWGSLTNPDWEVRSSGYPYFLKKRLTLSTNIHQNPKLDCKFSADWSHLCQTGLGSPTNCTIEKGISVFEPSFLPNIKFKTRPNLNLCRHKKKRKKNMTEKLKFVQERRKCWVGRENAVYQNFVYNVLKKAYYSGSWKRIIQGHSINTTPQLFPFQLNKSELFQSLTVSQTSPGFYVFAVQVFWKHCGKMGNCS